MKQLCIFLALVSFSVLSFGQVPEKLSYQAVIRDGSNDLVQNQPVAMRISILLGSVSGVSVYTETQVATTNINGLVSIEIGSGVTTDDFSTIVWSSSSYFIKTETDPAGGSNYSVVGVSQLLSVPYALHAKTAESFGPCGLSVGDIYQGGIIFYLDASGCHGLVAAQNDQATNISWDTSSPASFTLINAFSNGVFDGYYNAKLIAEICGADCAANELCFVLNLGGYDDWYLPTAYQLKLMYDNIGQGNLLGLGNVGGFANSFYWSSTEDLTNTALTLQFSNGVIAGDAKNDAIHLRAIRQF
jgi:hypothetical protein